MIATGTSFYSKACSQRLLHQSRRLVNQQLRNLRYRVQDSIPSQPATRQSATLLSNSAKNEIIQQTSTHHLLSNILMKPRTLPIPRWITPKHQTITLSEILGHASFLLVALSYYADDFIHLRIMAVAGSSAMLFFAYFHPHGRILWLPFQWNALFIAINARRITTVYRDRYDAECLSTELIQLRNKNFYLMDPADFARLARAAKMETFREGDLMIAQGEDNSYVRCVLEGRFKVFRDGKFTYLLEEANFVSESGMCVCVFACLRLKSLKALESSHLSDMGFRRTEFSSTITKETLTRLPHSSFVFL
jgi:hypothetical protein